jgi:hypothetical protein
MRANIAYMRLCVYGWGTCAAGVSFAFPFHLLGCVSALGPSPTVGLYVSPLVPMACCCCCAQVFDCPKQFYMVMELMSGGELFDRIVEKVRWCTHTHAAAACTHPHTHKYTLTHVAAACTPACVLTDVIVC